MQFLCVIPLQALALLKNPSDLLDRDPNGTKFMIEFFFLSNRYF